MAIDRIEGWDLYGPTDGLVIGNIDEFGGTPTLEATGGFFNGQHVSMNSTSDYARIDIDNIFNSGNHFLGFQFKIDSLTQNIIVQWTDENDGNGLHSHLSILASGALQFKEDVVAGAVLGTTAGGLIAAGTWYKIEVRIKPSTSSFSVANADGEFELRINGTVRLNLTNLSIGPADATSPRPVGLGKVELRGGSGVHRFDDIYIFNHAGTLNTDFAGDFSVQTLRPASDTATIDWIPVNAGDHYVEVDDVDPDGDTSYVSSQSSSDADIYEMTNLTGDVGAILGYSPLVLARREIGATQNIGMKLIGASGTAIFSGQNLAETYEYRHNVRSGSVNNASVLPTVSEVNAIQAGIYIP